MTFKVLPECCESYTHSPTGEILKAPDIPTDPLAKFSPLRSSGAPECDDCADAQKLGCSSFSVRTGI
jgi:hypothetical protein